MGGGSACMAALFRTLWESSTVLFMLVMEFDYYNTKSSHNK